jgi:hypothetical protein
MPASNQDSTMVAVSVFLAEVEFFFFAKSQLHVVFVKNFDWSSAAASNMLTTSGVFLLFCKRWPSLTTELIFQ